METLEGDGEVMPEWRCSLLIQFPQPIPLMCSRPFGGTLRAVAHYLQSIPPISSSASYHQFQFEQPPSIYHGLLIQSRRSQISKSWFTATLSIKNGAFVSIGKSRQEEGSQDKIDNRSRDRAVHLDLEGGCEDKDTTTGRK